jgi:hypothetical protein
LCIFDVLTSVFVVCAISSDDWEVFLSYLNSTLGGVGQKADDSSAVEKDVSFTFLDDDEVSFVAVKYLLTRAINCSQT